MNRKNDNSKNIHFKEFEKKLDQSNNFIDYFLLVGLDPSIAFESWIYEIQDKNNLDGNKIKPKIICSFPLFEKKTIAFDDGIIQYCFPQGFDFKEVPEEPKIFSFMLDNNYFSIHFPQKYLSCFLFYESLEDYRKIYESSYGAEKIAISTDNINIDSLCNNQSKSLPNNKSNSISEITGLNALNKNINEKYIKFSGKNFYIPKCLVIISLYPFFNEFETILLNLYNYSKRTMVDIPIEKFIENYAIEIPNPPRGIHSILFQLIDQPKKIAQNKMNELPLIDVDLKLLFNYFSPEQIIDIYRYIMLEQRVLFFSSDIVLLNPFIYGLISLLYPFQYQYQVVTILPQENLTILESITPFIGGINMKYVNTFFQDKDLVISDHIIIVDLDSKEISIVFPTDLGEFETSDKCKDIPDFPKGYRKKLEKSLNLIATNILKKKKAGPEGVTNEENENKFIDINIDINFNNNLSEIFFDFNANLLSNYSKYLNIEFYSSQGSPDFNSLFKIDDFLRDLYSCDKDFYSKFLSETQIFGDFLYKRMIPKDSSEKLQILAFDEKINELSVGLFQEKPVNIFTNSTEYDFISENRVVIQLPKQITDYEKEYLSNEANRINFLNYGIIVNKQKDANNFTFSYPIFPKFTSELFFYQNIRDYYIPTVFSEEINNLNKELVSKSHLGSVAIEQSDMENNIYIHWVEIWATCFWYCDKYEKDYWFSLLMIMLDKINHHEIEVFNLLFEAVSKYGTNDMVLKLYEILLKFKLNPTVKIREIVMKVFEKMKENKRDKKKITEKNEKEFLESYSFDNNKEKYLKKIQDIQSQGKKGFKKRSFKNEKNSNITSEKIYFYAFDSCIYCKEDLNLRKMCLNFSEMKRDLFWATCPSCKGELLPRLIVKLGDETNCCGNLESNTSTIDQVILYSPQKLKEDFTQSIVKDCGINLEVPEFKKRFTAIFWNSVWYFKLIGLDCDIFLPYSNIINMTDFNKINSHIEITTIFLANIDKEKKKDKNFQCTIEHQKNCEFSIII